jgi:hypothetical protein
MKPHDNSMKSSRVLLVARMEVRLLKAMELKGSVEVACASGGLSWSLHVLRFIKKAVPAIVAVAALAEYLAKTH